MMDTFEANNVSDKDGNPTGENVRGTGLSIEGTHAEEAKAA